MPMKKADWLQRHRENWNAGPVMQRWVQAWSEWFERASAHPRRVPRETLT